MPKRENRKCRQWERARRDRLNCAFTALYKIFPSYDPCVTLSKIEILQKATFHIEDLKRVNREILCGGQQLEDEKSNRIKMLEERLSILLKRNEQLVSLLRKAEIPVPSELDLTKQFAKPKLWSNRIDKKVAQHIKKQFNSECTNEKGKNVESNQKNKIQEDENASKENVQVSSHKNSLPTVKVISSKPKTNSKKTFATNVTSNSKNNQNDVRLSKSTSLQLTSVATTRKNETKSLAISKLMNLQTKNTFVTNSTLLSTPIMATGFNERQTLSSLGPGTLILADGTIYPILPVANQTIIQPPTVLTAVVNPTSNPTLVLVNNQNAKITSVSAKKNNQVLVKSVNKTPNITEIDENSVSLKQYSKILPKTLGLKRNIVRKISIPPLRKVNKQINNLTKLKTKVKKKIVQKNGSKENQEVKSTTITNKIKENTQKSSISGSNNINVEKIEGNTSAKFVEPAEKRRKLDAKLIEESVKNVQINSNNEDHNQSLGSKDNSTENSQKKSVGNRYSVDSLCNNNSLKNSDSNPEVPDGVMKSDSLNNSSIKPIKETSTDGIQKIKDKKIGSESFAKKEDSFELEKDNTIGKSIDSLVTNEVQLSDALCNNSTVSLSCAVTSSVTTIDSKVTDIVSTTVAVVDQAAKVVETLSLALPPTDFSNDIFASLQVPHGTHNPESISPTAAFLLAFPLVSTVPGSKLSEAADDENSDSQHGTPTLLQIGNIEKQVDTSTSNLISFENIPNLFSFNENKGMKESSTISRKFDKNEFERSNKIKCNVKDDQVTKMSKDKLLSSITLDSINSNCLFSDMPLFQSTMSSSIFNYEHTPVTHNLSKLPEICPLTSVNTDCKSKDLLLSSSCLLQSQMPSVTSDSTYFHGIANSTNSDINIKTGTSFHSKLPATNSKSNEISNSQIHCQNLHTDFDKYKTSNIKLSTASSYQQFSHSMTTPTYSNAVKTTIDKNDLFQKPLVNWMTTPDNRHKIDNTYGSNQNTDYNLLLPNANYSLPSTQFNKPYNSNSKYYTKTETVPNYSHTQSNQISWTSSNKLPPVLDSSNSLVSSTLPMLVGDLALNTTQSSKYDHKDYSIKDITDKYKTKDQYGDNQNISCFSVSHLVEHNKNNQNNISNNQRKSQNRNNKLNMPPKQLKRVSKPDSGTNKSDNNYNFEKNASDSKPISNRALHSFSTSYESYTDTSVNKDIDWMKLSVDTKTSYKYKACSSAYSAEALIANTQNNTSSDAQKCSLYTSSQQYIQPSTKKPSIGSSHYDPLGTSFYSTSDYSSVQDSYYYSQSSNNNFTYTTSSSVHQPNNFMPNVSNFVNSNNLPNEFDTDCNNSASIPVNSSVSILHTNNNTANNHPSKSNNYSKNKYENRTSHSDRKTAMPFYPNAAQTNKRSTAKRKQSNADNNLTNTFPSFSSDLGFLSLPGNSSMLSTTDDPFHSNNFFTSASQMGINNSQNLIYSKGFNHQNSDFPVPVTHCNLLPPPLPPVPLSRSNVLPVSSPGNMGGGNSLTNFNLSTIFPEINKPVPPGIFDNTSYRSVSSNNLPILPPQQSYNSTFSNMQ